MFSKVLANRLTKVLHEIVHKDQSYCVEKNRLITDNLHLIRDVFVNANCNDLKLGLLYLDQETQLLIWVDHVFLFDALNAFGFGIFLFQSSKLFIPKQHVWYD